MTRLCLPAGSVVALALVAACGATPVPGGEDGCTSDVQCDDGNPCTDDACGPSGACESVPNTAPCDDGNACTADDVCIGGVCTGGTNSCSCETTADCAIHEDGDACNGTLVCDPSSLCVVDPATVVTCPTDQDTDCSKSTCVPATGECQLAPVATGTACDDSDTCTDGDHCRAGECVGGVELCCDDQVNNDDDDLSDCDDPDCADHPVCEACPALVPVEDSPLPVESATAAVESTTINGFADDYVYNAAGTLKIGTRRDWGGTIVFFGMDNGSPGLNNTNAIDSADTGREVQVAFYDVDRWYQNCAWNASCNATPSPTECPQQMMWLGWNPVQGGNRCNNGSGVDDVILEDGAIDVKTTPLYWNPHWDRSDCNSDACSNPAVNMRRSDVEVDQRVRFVRPNIVELSYVVTNLSAIDHAVSAHEFPTVYTSFGRMGTPDLDRLFDSTRTEIPINDHPPADATFRYKNFTSPGGWVSLQNDALDYGIGLMYENGLDFYQAWQADDPDFNNFRGLFSFGIPAFGQVRARSYLILGSLDTVAAEAQWLDDNLAPFGSLDAPTSDTPLSGVVPVHGWAMDNKGVAAVQLIIDGGAPIPLSYGASRPDVCRVWPGYAQCAGNNMGFTGSFNADALAPSECGNVLEVRVVDTDGNARIIARRRVFRAP